jgi:hypothetical protein
MWDKGFRHVPLLKAGKVMGVVSRGDFQDIAQSARAGARPLGAHALIGSRRRECLAQLRAATS